MQPPSAELGAVGPYLHSHRRCICAGNKEVLCDITSNKLNDEIKNLNMMLDRGKKLVPGGVSKGGLTLGLACAAGVLCAAWQGPCTDGPHTVHYPYLQLASLKPRKLMLTRTASDSWRSAERRRPRSCCVPSRWGSWTPCSRTLWHQS